VRAGCKRLISTGKRSGVSAMVLTLFNGQIHHKGTKPQRNTKIGTGKFAIADLRCLRSLCLRAFVVHSASDCQNAKHPQLGKSQA
jgi:hypothetical protein